ncbi:MAG: glycerophosphodiester phosphodiesterase [Micromonosporaceae bacterium]|nr:glycerophosphodiester phosphodiesterase [Micromonosporaceae bacterium]
MAGSRAPVAISAHQGGSEIAPAATLEAYQSSLDTGAEYVEFDIRRTGDGAWVVYHDDHVTESPQHTPLSQLSHPQLSGLTGYAVPLMTEVMELIAGKAIGHLDLKDIGGEDEIITTALEILGRDNFVATTLEDVSVARIKQRFPQARAALSLGRDLTELSTARRIRARLSEAFPLRRIRACGADWVAVHHKLARRTVLQICARHGIGAMVWTVNEQALIDLFVADPRVAVLITDRPGFAVERRAALQGAP